MKFEIDKELLEKILNYLASKPYLEVWDYIAKLQQLKIIQNENKKD